MDINDPDLYTSITNDVTLPVVRHFFADEAYLTRLHGSMDGFKEWVKNHRPRVIAFTDAMLQGYKHDTVRPTLMILIHRPGEPPERIEILYVPLWEMMQSYTLKKMIPLFIRQMLLGKMINNFLLGQKIVAFHTLTEAWVTSRVLEKDATEYVNTVRITEDPDRKDVMVILSDYIYGSRQQQFFIQEVKGVRSLGSCFLDDEEMLSQGVLSGLLQKTAGMQMQPDRIKVRNNFSGK